MSRYEQNASRPQSHLLTLIIGSTFNYRLIEEIIDPYIALSSLFGQQGQLTGVVPGK